ncbi:MAG TPA: glycosyltransferase [Tepidisphaeraceae bacterium]|nr:glycosyltransferase [Tepidisphaeraceae bacterium]
MTPTKLLIAIMDLHGGAGVFCRYLATGIRRYCPDLDPELMVWRDRGILGADKEIFSRIHRLQLPVGMLGLPGQLFKLRAALKKMEPGVVVTAGTYANLMVPLATRTPVLLTEHNHMSTRLGALSGTRRRMMGTLMRAGYRRRPVVVPSEGVAVDLRERFRAGNVHVIPHGLDRERVAELAQEKPADLPEPQSYIVAVGRLANQKDYPTLLQAYAQACHAGIGQQLVVVGDGPDLDQLTALTESLGIKDRVRFLGHRDNPFPYIAGARCYALSSIWEGFGLALLEAMTLGKPCVATDCPSGPGEILDGGKFGPLLKPRDVDGLASALVDLCTSDASYGHYAELAQVRSEEYSLEKMARRYQSLIRGLVG